MRMFSDDTCETLVLIAQAVKSGLSLPAAIRLSVAERRKPLDRAFLRLADRIETGSDPANAIKQVRLPEKIAAMFEVALKSRNFSATFEELVLIEEKRSATLRTLAISLMYLLLLAFFTIALGVFALAYIVPQFKKIFDDFDTKLPLATESVTNLSDLVCDPGFWAGLIVFLIALRFLSRWFCPRFLFYIPLVGGIFRNIYQSRFLWQMASMIQRGVPLPDAFEECGKIMSNPAYKQDCRQAASAARSGMSLDEIAIRYHWLFPNWVYPMIGAQQGTLSEAVLAKSLSRAADTEDKQKDISLNLFQTIIVPITIFFIIQIIGATVLTLFLPLIKLVAELSS